MDMFMDKLAQKLTAQEIIKANTAADMEELNRLKNQIAEYNQCLAKLQKMVDDASLKLAGAQAHGDEINNLLTESLNGVSSLQLDLEDLRKGQDKLGEQIGVMDKSVAWQVELVSKAVGEKVDQLAGQVEGQVSGTLTEKLGSMEEMVHKECVRVYRNVQAVITEESQKQKEAGDMARTSKGKISAILGISVAAMIFSLASIVIQVLGILNFF